jgi:hypothetical protein
VWTFSTGATMCQPPLPPSSVNPTSGSTGICSNTVVAVTNLHGHAYQWRPGPFRQRTGQ